MATLASATVQPAAAGSENIPSGFSSRAVAFVAVLLGGTPSCTRRKTEPPPRVLFEMGDVVTPRDPELQSVMGKPKMENAQEVPPPEEPRKR